ncbi:MAG: acetyl-CoA decarbonylase/synthase complex subunit gamma, partial [Candidatus Omnitrophica bacterium]|nr:acetyl-CoA decarbonylase/synthase complex subunit gamma [Candidatus Omnitrophota bacterium]
MALSGLDIYKLLPKTNCRECGFATCLAFAMQLAKKAVVIEKCPYISQESKKALEASAQPPIKLISIGEGENRLEIGNESVMFRHEEKFHRPCGIGFIIEDSLKDAEIKDRICKINKLKFERVGQKLDVNIVAISSKSDAKRFAEAVKLVSAATSLPLMLMSSDTLALKQAMETAKNKRPLLYAANKNNFSQIGEIAKEYKAPLVVNALDLDEISNLTLELNKQGVTDLILDTGKKALSEKIFDLTQIRRQALKKNNRSLGYPVLTIIDSADPYEEAMEAATFISKYAGIILIKSIESWQALSLLTLRQNIYTDPQKPLQIEPKLYPVGQANEKSPVLVTTNFSLSYYTVLGEVEASKIPSYILSVDTEGMSVLTAWAAEKFTPGKISDSLNQFGVTDAVAHKKLVIPGYVAVMSGELEETSGWQVIVGPKEAAGLPSFLK